MNIELDYDKLAKRAYSDLEWRAEQLAKAEILFNYNRNNGHFRYDYDRHKSMYDAELHYYNEICKLRDSE